MIIDFDDMMIGPPVQDLWLLLPDQADQCRRELDLLVRGYEMFRKFDVSTLRLIEPLRAMRIIYYLAWCSTQIDGWISTSLLAFQGSWDGNCAGKAGGANFGFW